MLAVVIENVTGTLKRWHGKRAFFPLLLEVLQRAVPFFHWRIDEVNAKSYKLPHQRPRVLMRGLHKICHASGVPACMEPFGKARLLDILSTRLPHFPLARLSPQQQRNHHCYVSMLRAASAEGKLRSNEPVVFALDRQPGLVWKVSWSQEAVPTLTTGRSH